MAARLDLRSSSLMADSAQRQSGRVVPVARAYGWHAFDRDRALADGLECSRPAPALQSCDGNFSRGAFLQFISARHGGWRCDEGVLRGERNTSQEERSRRDSFRRSRHRTVGHAAVRHVHDCAELAALYPPGNAPGHWFLFFVGGGPQSLRFPRLSWRPFPPLDWRAPLVAQTAQGRVARTLARQLSRVRQATLVREPRAGTVDGAEFRLCSPVLGVGARTANGGLTPRAMLRGADGDLHCGSAHRARWSGSSRECVR